MNTAWWISGALLALIWGSRIVDRVMGGRLPDISGEEWSRGTEPPPRVSVIVPARNEAANVEPAITSLLELDYPDCEVIAIDDRSDDATGAILDRIAAEHPNRARLRVLHVNHLPQGWLGKNHALWLGAQQATGEWLLFTDADVVFRPESLKRSIAYAESAHADHVVLFLTLRMHSMGERMVLAFFSTQVYFVSRPWAVSDPRKRDFIGMGAFNLVRRRVYDRIGTHRALALAVLDDLELGRRIKQAGFAQHVVRGRDLISLRWGEGAFGILANLEKNLFAVVGYRVWAALALVALSLLAHVSPFVGIWIAPGWARLPFAIAVASIAWMYWDISRWLGQSPLYFLLHPVAAVLTSYTMLVSTWRTILGGGVTWRGTKYSLQELRKQSAPRA